MGKEYTGLGDISRNSRDVAEYYDKWLQEHAGDEALPDSLEERHRRLMEIRRQAYEKLCDVVYEKKGFTAEAIPKSETVERFGLMDEQARQLLDEFGV